MPNRTFGFAPERWFSLLHRPLLIKTLLALAISPAALPAFAQIGIYGEFSAADFNVPNTGWQTGTTFGIYDNHWTVPFFALGVDGRGTVVNGDGVSIASGLVGPRLVFKPHVLPVMPYVEALVGVGHGDAGNQGSSAYTSQTKFEYNGIVGLDYTFFPRLDWRVVEFSYGGLPGFSGTFNPRTLSTGIVFRLP